MPTNKETIYIDIDDEITSIIEKVNAAPSKIVALVLPKRATVLQSIVNMKLLKRAAGQARKNIVLITSETGLLPLAGAVGLHVAKTLQSKPVIPPMPDRGEPGDIDEVGDDAGALHDGHLEPAAPDTHAASAAALAATADEEAIEIDSADDAAEADAPKPKKKHSLRGGKISVPNFERFRTRLFIGGAAFVLLLVGWYFMFVAMPKATVTLKTDSASIQTSIPITASAAIKEFSAEKKEVPAVYKEIKLTDTEKVPATGQKDVGNKASGTLSVFNCTDNDVDLPAGSVFSNSGFSFSTDQVVTVPASDFYSQASGGACKKNKSASVPITATQPGDKYNLSSGRTFLTGVADTLSGTGSAMTGGTTQILQVVSQTDLENAKARMKGRQDEKAKTELKKLFGNDGLFAMIDTFKAADPAVTSEPKLDEQAAEVTVTAVGTYGLLGVKKDNLHELVSKEVESQIDKTKQTLLDDGVEGAVFVVNERKTNDSAKLTMQALAQAGPQLDAKAIAESIRGMKKGEAQSTILKRPGIKDVTIEYSPFWVLSTPKASKKITVIFEKPPIQASKPRDAEQP